MVRPRGEKVGEIAAKAVVQLSTGKSFTVDGLLEKPREFYREEVRVELRAVTALNNVELITALIPLTGSSPLSAFGCGFSTGSSDVGPSHGLLQITPDKLQLPKRVFFFGHDLPASLGPYPAKHVFNPVEAVSNTSGEHHYPTDLLGYGVEALPVKWATATLADHSPLPLSPSPQTDKQPRFCSAVLMLESQQTLQPLSGSRTGS